MKPDFDKGDGLIPVIVQHALTQDVLMLAYMNEEAYVKTKREKRVTFYSRSKQRLWTKGETSGHILELQDMLLDCDNDTILAKVIPTGPVCHTGSSNCFNDLNPKGFLYQLEKIINDRIEENSSMSYTRRLFNEGINKLAQKVGEEAIEVVIEAKDRNDTLLKNEVADLLFHLLVLLRFKNIKFQEVEEVLLERNAKS